MRWLMFICLWGLVAFAWVLIASYAETAWPGPIHDSLMRGGCLGLPALGIGGSGLAWWGDWLADHPARKH